MHNIQPLYAIAVRAVRERNFAWIPYAVPFILAADKTLQKMRTNQSGWRIEDLQAVAERSDVEWRRPGRGGSHVIFSASGVREIVSVPSKRPIKPVYIKQFLALIDAAQGLRG